MESYPGAHIPRAGDQPKEGAHMVSVIDFLCLPLEEQALFSIPQRYVYIRQLSEEPFYRAIPNLRFIIFQVVVSCWSSDYAYLQENGEEARGYLQDLLQKGVEVSLENLLARLNTDERLFLEQNGSDSYLDEKEPYNIFLRGSISEFLSLFSSVDENTDRSLYQNFWINNPTHPSPFLIKAIFRMLKQPTGLSDLTPPAAGQSPGALPLRRLVSWRTSIEGLYEFIEEISSIVESRRSRTIMRKFFDRMGSRSNGHHAKQYLETQLATANLDLLDKTTVYSRILQEGCTINEQATNKKALIQNFLIRHFVEVFATSLPQNYLTPSLLDPIAENISDPLDSSLRSGLTALGLIFFDKKPEDYTAQDVHSLVKNLSQSLSFPMEAVQAILIPFYHYPSRLGQSLYYLLRHNGQGIKDELFDLGFKFVDALCRKRALMRAALFANGGYAPQKMSCFFIKTYNHQCASDRTLFESLEAPLFSSIGLVSTMPYQIYNQSLLITMVKRDKKIYRASSNREDFFFYLAQYQYADLLQEVLDRETLINVEGAALFKKIRTFCLKQERWPVLYVLWRHPSCQWSLQERLECLQAYAQGPSRVLSSWAVQESPLAPYVDPQTHFCKMDAFLLSQISSFQPDDQILALKKSIELNDPILYKNLTDQIVLLPKGPKTLGAFSTDLAAMIHPIQEKPLAFSAIRSFPDLITAPHIKAWIQTALLEGHPLIAAEYINYSETYCPSLFIYLLMERTKIIMTFVDRAHRKDFDKFTPFPRLSEFEAFTLSYIHTQNALAPHSHPTNDSLDTLLQKFSLSPRLDPSFIPKRLIGFAITLKDPLYLGSVLALSQVSQIHDRNAKDMHNVFTYTHKKYTLEAHKFFATLCPQIVTNPDPQGINGFLSAVELGLIEHAAFYKSLRPEVIVSATSDGEDSYSLAIRSRSLAMFRWVWAQGKDYYIADCHGISLGARAVLCDSISCLEELHVRNVPLQHCDRHSQSLLHYAVIYDRRDCWALFIAIGNKYNLWRLIDNKSETAMFLMARKGWTTELIALAHSSFASLDAWSTPNYQGKTLFEYLGAVGSRAVASQLLSLLEATFTTELPYLRRKLQGTPTVTQAPPRYSGVALLLSTAQGVLRDDNSELEEMESVISEYDDEPLLGAADFPGLEREAAAPISSSASAQNISQSSAPVIMSSPPDYSHLSPSIQALLASDSSSSDSDDAHIQEHARQKRVTFAL